MAKFYGEIGFADLVTDDLGVTKEHITKNMYTGDLLRNNRRLENSGQVNDDLNISNEISIIGDPYAYQNFHAIRYVKFMNAKWKVSTFNTFSRRRLSWRRRELSCTGF